MTSNNKVLKCFQAKTKSK